MLRRRTGFLAKMALEVAYRCLGEKRDVPTVFCSRHGEVKRSVELLSELARGELMSPTSFGLSVHNAAGGLFSIARSDRASNIALSAGHSTIEHGVIEACGLLADGASEVLLVAYDCPLPPAYADFQDVDEQAFAWAWLMQPASAQSISLSWTAAGSEDDAPAVEQMPGGLEVLRFYLSEDPQLMRIGAMQRWRWERHV